MPFDPSTATLFDESTPGPRPAFDPTTATLFDPATAQPLEAEEGRPLTSAQAVKQLPMAPTGAGEPSSFTKPAEPPPTLDGYGQPVGSPLAIPSFVKDVFRDWAAGAERRGQERARAALDTTVGGTEGRILGRAREGFGDEPLGITPKTMQNFGDLARELGVLPPDPRGTPEQQFSHEPGDPMPYVPPATTAQKFNEAVTAPVARAVSQPVMQFLDLIVRTGNAGIQLTAQSAIELGNVLGMPQAARDLAGYVEAAGMTGAPHMPGRPPSGYRATVEELRKEHDAGLGIWMTRNEERGPPYSEQRQITDDGIPKPPPEAPAAKPPPPPPPVTPAPASPQAELERIAKGQPPSGGALPMLERMAARARPPAEPPAAEVQPGEGGIPTVRVTPPPEVPEPPAETAPPVQEIIPDSVIPEKPPISRNQPETGETAPIQPEIRPETPETENAAPKSAEPAEPPISGTFPYKGKPADVSRETPPVIEPEVVPPTRAPRAPRVALPYVPVPREPTRLIDYLRRPTVLNQGTIHETTIPGGLIDTGGDINAIIGGTRGRPGLITNRGRTLDDATLQAWHDGYLPGHGDQRPEINHLLDAIRDDHAGAPRYSDQDIDRVQDYHAARGQNAEIDRLAHEHDLPTRGMTNGQFFDAVHERLSVEQQAREMQSQADAHYAAQNEWMQRARRETGTPADQWTNAHFLRQHKGRSLEDLEHADRQETAHHTTPRGAEGVTRRGPVTGDQGIGQEGSGPRGGGVRHGRGSDPRGPGEGTDPGLGSGQRLPVATLTGTELPAHGTPDRRRAIGVWARQNLQGKSVRSDALGAVVRISARGIGKVLNHADEGLLDAFPAVPGLIAHGERLGPPLPERDPRHDPATKAWHRLGGLVQHPDGSISPYQIYVREDRNGHFFYDFEKGSDASLMAGSGGGPRDSMQSPVGLAPEPKIGDVPPEDQSGLGAGRRLPAPPPAGGGLFGPARETPAPRQAEPTIRNDARQAVMPGMGPSAVQAQAARDAAGPRSDQLPADQGLFGRPEPVQPELAPQQVSRWPTTAGFTDELHLVPDRMGGQAAAAAFVFERGRETGFEHIAVVHNATGEIVHAGTLNLPGAVMLSRDTQHDIGAYTVHHNHPNNSGLSDADVGMVANQGLTHVVAHAPNGHTYIVSLVNTPQWAAVDRVADLTKNNIALRSAYQVALNRASELLIKLRDTKQITGEEGDASYGDVASRILSATGLVDYTSTRPLLPAVEVALRSYLGSINIGRHDIDRSTVTIRPEERNAGLPTAVRGPPDTRPAGSARGDGQGPRVSGGYGQDRLLAGPGELDRVPLYSAVGRAVEGLSQAKGTGAQMLAMIQKTPGVKAEELKWIGLDDWLRGQGHVTKAAIAEYVRANSLDVREVVKGEPDPQIEQRIADLHTEIMQLEAAGDPRWRELSLERGALLRQTPREPKFGQYQLPGGSNYREVLITLPPKVIDQAALDAQIRGLLKDWPNDIRTARNPADQPRLDALLAEWDRNQSKTETQYRSSHWDEPNVLAHMRMSDRVDASGAKTLLVEEVQSDWHQKGRKEGYKGTEDKRRMEAIDAEQARMIQGVVQRDSSLERYDGGMLESRAYERMTPTERARYDVLTTERGREADQIRANRSAVPDAPFKTTWPAMIMRRAIQYAVDNGYERISWTPGEVQADRYSLANHVSGVAWTPEKGTLHVRKLGQEQYYADDRSQGVTKANLADHIGKDAADKMIANGPDERGVYYLEGDDLRVGGAGMKAFYDRMLPNEVQKIVGKFGAKVEQSEVGTSSDMFDVVSDRGNFATFATREAAEQAIPQIASEHGLSAGDLSVRQGEKTTQTVHSVELTERLRDAVAQEGLPLFAGPTTLPPSLPPGPLKRAGEAAMSAARDLTRSIAVGLTPMRTGSVRAQTFAANFANALRKVAYHYGEIDRELVRNFTPVEREKMGRAMDAQSVHETVIRDLPPADQARETAAFDATGAGLTGLTPKQSKPLTDLDLLGSDVWRRMQDIGMVDPRARRIPFYFTRQIIMWSEAAGFSRAGSGQGGSGRGINPIGANLTTAGPMRREHLTPEQTEAAAKAKLGAGAMILRDIRSLPARLAYAERAIAGVELMNHIEQVGRETGADLVIRGDIPGLLNPADYFTITDHPSFRKWTGNGWQAIHVAKEFEGPLKAILTQPSSAWYRAAMGFKAAEMYSIMTSPGIHFWVEWGRAFPTMPGKMLTFKTYRDGSRLRKDHDYMDQAITDGIAPLGHTNAWRTDPVSLADQANVEGRNAFIRALGTARDKMAKGARLGIDWGAKWREDVMRAPHQTLLWDQVFNLQIGIYDTMRSRYIKKGYAPEVAGTMAAHLANRYAGALPSENLSRAANMAANLLMFSRSFTLGNLGVMKDMFTGAPSHTLARIEQMAGPEARTKAKRAMQRKAIAAVALDIGLAYIGVSLLQAGVAALLGAGDSEVDKWLAEGKEEEDKAKGNPFSMLKYLPQFWNEPGKTDRAYVGKDDEGRGIYVRLPPGKVGEEFIKWPLDFGTMLLNKSSPMARAIMESVIGQDTLGRQIYKPHPEGFRDRLDIAGNVVKHIAEANLPMSLIQGGAELFQHHVMGRPATGDPGVSALKVLGPLTGLAQISSGYPGGPAAGEIHAQDERQRYDINKAMPDIRRKIKAGDLEGARDDMVALGIQKQQAQAYVRQTITPGPSRGAQKRVQLMPPEIQQRIERDLQMTRPRP